MPPERPGRLDRSSSRVDGSRNVFLDGVSRSVRSPEDLDAHNGGTAVDRAVIVVGRADPPARERPLTHRSSSRPSRRARCRGRILALVTTVRELHRRVAAGIVVMPSELPAIALVFATLAVATVLLIQRNDARAQRDRARQQTASASHAAIQTGHENQALLRELERAGQRVRDASRAAAVAARHERRWRQIAARRRQDAQRGRHHR